MSVIKNSLDGEKVELPRHNSGAFWDAMQSEYAAGNVRRWKMLAMLSLHENCGWSLEMLAQTFDQSKATIRRKLETVKAEVAARFKPGDDDGQP